MSIFIAIAMIMNVNGSNDVALQLKPVQGTKKVIISFQHISEKSITIFLKDENNVIIYKEKVHSNGIMFTKIYDLSYLEDGQYTAVLADQKSKENLSTRSFFIKDESIYLNQDKTGDIKEPFIKLMNNQIIIAFINKYNEKVQVMIHDKTGDLIYKEKLGSNLSISQKFDATRLAKGEYRVALLAGDYSYYEIVNK